MELIKYRVVRERYNGISKYYPEYKFVLFPFIWFRWHDYEIWFYSDVNFLSLADCLEYINHKRYKVKITLQKKEIEIFKVDL